MVKNYSSTLFPYISVIDGRYWAHWIRNKGPCWIVRDQSFEVWELQRTSRKFWKPAFRNMIKKFVKWIIDSWLESNSRRSVWLCRWSGHDFIFDACQLGVEIRTRLWEIPRVGCYSGKHTGRSRWWGSLMVLARTGKTSGSRKKIGGVRSGGPKD